MQLIRSFSFASKYYLHFINSNESLICQNFKSNGGGDISGKIRGEKQRNK